MIAGLGNFLPQRGEAPPTEAELSKSADAPKPEDELSFWDLLDVINPLQHIPVVSSIYRHFSGDEISAPARLAGGFLFGGVIGMASSAVSVGFEEITGDDIGGHIMAALDPDAEEAEGSRPPGTMLAAYNAAASAYGEEGGGSSFASRGASFHGVDIPA